MTLIFYPHEDELQSSDLQQKLEVLQEAAERYKAVILDLATKNPNGATNSDPSKKSTPRDLKHAFNWEEISRLLQEIRELPEGTQSGKISKADRLTKIASIYEVLRGAKMPKLEAVRIALVNEANQLRGKGTQVA